MSNNVKKDVKDKKKELVNFLFELPPQYITSAYPSDDEKLIDRINRTGDEKLIAIKKGLDAEKLIASENRRFRAIIWELVLSGDVLSLCNFSQNDGLLLKLRNNEYRSIKDDRLFILELFVCLNHFYFEYLPGLYRYFLIKKLSSLPQLYDELVDVENNLAQISTYKLSRKKRGIPLEETQLNAGKELKLRVNNVISEVKSAGFDKTFWNKTKKRNEKILIKSLYDCFKKVNSRISKEDIFHCIAKVTLLLGTYKRSEAVRNSGIVTSQMLLDESSRVEQIYRRFQKKISSN